jgi:hypothetical protein
MSESALLELEELREEGMETDWIMLDPAIPSSVAQHELRFGPQLYTSEQMQFIQRATKNRRRSTTPIPPLEED